MRGAFVTELSARASKGEDLMLLVGDLGYGVVESFSEKFPHLFLNAGIAEQNMTGMAAGVASDGTRVFTYSIANFPTIRALEQIRNDVCYHSFPVTIVSIGSGVDYGTLGYSHFAVEDIAVMRPMPGLVVYSPADNLELFSVLDSIFASKEPSYLRLPKDAKSDLPVVGAWLDATWPRKVSSGGSSLLLLATGSMTQNVLDACGLLNKELTDDFDVFSVPQLSPLGLRGLDWDKYEAVLTAEEHVLSGGFGSAVLEFLSDQGIRIPVERLGLARPENLPVGSSNYLLEAAGLDPYSISKAILKTLRALS